MKILIIATHPNIQNSLVNKFWMENLKKEKNVTLRFLDELYPDRNINVKKEQEFLEIHDRIVFQFPFYWYSMPSLMRDYFDFVLEFGWAYGPKGDTLKDKEFLCGISIGAPEYSYQGGSYNNFTISELLKPLEATANAIQMVYLPPFTLFNTPRLTEEDLKKSIKDYIAHINNEDINHRKFLEKLKLKNSESSFIDL